MFVVLGPFECMRIGVSCPEGEDVGLKPGEEIPGKIVSTYETSNGRVAHVFVDIEDQTHKFCGVPLLLVMPKSQADNLANIAQQVCNAPYVGSLREALELAWMEGREHGAGEESS